MAFLVEHNPSLTRYLKPSNLALTNTKIWPATEGSKGKECLFVLPSDLSCRLFGEGDRKICAIPSSHYLASIGLK